MLCVRFFKVCGERELEGVVFRFVRADGEVLREMDGVLFFLKQGFLVEVGEGEAVGCVGGGECCFGDAFYVEVTVEDGAVKVECAVFGDEVFRGELVVGFGSIDACAFQCARDLGGVGVVVGVCMRDAVYFHVDAVVIASGRVCGVGTEREARGSCVVGRFEFEEWHGVGLARFYREGDGVCQELFVRFFSNGEIPADVAEFGDRLTGGVVLYLKGDVAERGYDRGEVEGGWRCGLAQCVVVERGVVFKEDGAGVEMIELNGHGLFE